MKYDLEERTFAFALDCRRLIRQMEPKTIAADDCRQLIRSSGSVGANYREASECLSRKDFVMRIKICRKEAKESGYWLRLLSKTNEANSEQLDMLANEATELRKIFGSIVEKSR